MGKYRRGKKKEKKRKKREFNTNRMATLIEK